MLLEPLVSTIETIKERIATHGPALRQNETRTRAALIDPLLQALGWDVSDPSLVTPEYRVDVGWADYALKGPGDKPAAVIEAKRLGTFLENHLSQAVGYCIEQGVAYAAVTDGDRWQLYRTFDQVPMEQKRILDVVISGTYPYECALKFLLLWQPNLVTGKAVEPNAPVLATLPSTPLVQLTPIVESVATPIVGREPVTSSVSTAWMPLSSVDPNKKSNPPPREIRFDPNKKSNPPPREIRFATKSTCPILVECAG